MESSSPPWRVFDSPGAPGSGGADNASPSPPSDFGGLAGANLRMAIAGIGGALAIGALAVVVAVAGVGAETIDGPAVSGSVEATGRPAVDGSEIVVDVAGAVVAPGLYHLPSGSRVADAIDAAGGFSPRVDVDRVGTELNLAAAVVDGGQIRVPSRDDAPATSGPGVTGGSTNGGSDLVNLNAATQAELEALPGIGPVTAEKIISSRETAPFRSVEDLRERGLVGEKTFEKIRALLTAG